MLQIHMHGEAQMSYFTKFVAPHLGQCRACLHKCYMFDPGPGHKSHKVVRAHRQMHIVDCAIALCCLCDCALAGFGFPVSRGFRLHFGLIWSLGGCIRRARG